MALADVIRVTPLLAPDPAVRGPWWSMPHWARRPCWWTSSPCRPRSITDRSSGRPPQLRPKGQRCGVMRSRSRKSSGGAGWYQILPIWLSNGDVYRRVYHAQPAAPVATPLFVLGDSWRFSSNASDGMGWTLPSFERCQLGHGTGTIVGGFPRSCGGSECPAEGNRVAAGSLHWIPVDHLLRAPDLCARIPRFGEVTITNRIDDGAVFYLNGRRSLAQNNLPAAPAVIGNGTRALAFNCAGNATCGGFCGCRGAASPLVAGNVLAVAHNFDPRSPDITPGIRSGRTGRARPSLPS